MGDLQSCSGLSSQSSELGATQQQILGTEKVAERPKFYAQAYSLLLQLVDDFYNVTMQHILGKGATPKWS